MTRFGDAAGRLAGLAGALLGWQPAEFWEATPAELAAVIEALGGERPAAAGADDLTRLKEMFPMDEEIDSLLIAVRADTGGFDRDVAAMKASLGDGLGGGADAAGRSIESALGRAVRTGKLGFDDLKSVALKALDEIAGAALKSGLGAAAGGGGLAGLAGSLLSGVLGLPGRATGGPVAPGAAYLVGERGPELFVPTASGRVAPIAAGPGGRDVRVAIAINAPAGTEPQALARSSRQVARAISRALDAAEG